jgi:aryl-alcohol dehydrogenase-like predicted oxidoreductase
LKYRLLGRTGIHVSQLCCGTMPFGGDADEAASAAMYKAARDAGINFFDTADQYSKGRSEEILGKLIGGHRDELVIATKCFNPTGEDRNAKGLSRRHIMRAVEASLKRLNVDRVEVLFMHHQDRHTPIEESLRAFEDLVRDGKVLYPGLSNYSAWQTQQALAIQEAHGWARLQVIEPMYNLVKRQAESEILPMALANGLGVIPYSPSAAGMLTGKYSAGAAGGTTAGRIKSNKMYEARYSEPWAFEVADKFAEFCKKHGMHPMSAAVAWVGAHPAVTAPIIGGRNLEQLRPSLESVKIEMTPALHGAIASLSRTPPPATDRLEESKPVL